MPEVERKRVTSRYARHADAGSGANEEKGWYRVKQGEERRKSSGGEWC